MASQRNGIKPSPKQLNEILVDRERTLNLFRAVAKQHFARFEDETTGNPELDAAVALVGRGIILSGGDRNVNMVFNQAKSPIERAFLNSFLFKISIEDALSVLVYGPIRELDVHMRNVVGEYNGFVEWLTGFFHFRGERNLNGAYKELDRWLEAGKMPEEAYDWAIHMLGANGLIDFVNAFHIMIQPTIKLDGKAFRPDLAIWVPGDPSIKIIVECDGFAYHSSKEAFQRDRARDRQLMGAGFRVRRYAGTEIYADPIAAGKDLVDFLHSLTVDRQPRLYDAVMEQVRQMEEKGTLSQDECSAESVDTKTEEGCRTF